MSKRKPGKQEAEKKIQESTESAGEECHKEDEGGDPHSDKEQDIELIKKMIAQHLGDKVKDASPEEMEALESLGKEAYQAHKEMGSKEDEAMQHAGNALKLAHHMSQKSKTKEGSDMGKDKKKDPAVDDKSPVVEAEAAAVVTETENKESNREVELEKKLLEAEGRIAALEAKEHKDELSRHVDKVLKESKLPSSVTKKFREAAGDFKTAPEFDGKWKLFLAGVHDSRSAMDFSLMAEKAATTETGDRADEQGTGLDFSQCAD